jgi:hypothetical protein
MRELSDFEFQRECMNQKIIDSVEYEIIARPIVASNKDIARFLDNLDKFERKSRLSSSMPIKGF